MTDKISYKDLEFSAATQVHLVKNSDLNGSSHLFGGILVTWIDEVATVIARRHCETDVTTACIDNLIFKKSASLGDLIVISGHVTYVGNTSLEIRVDSYVEDLSGKRYPINRAFLTFVSLDDNGNPIPIRFGLVCSNESQKAEWESALKRVEFRKKRKLEG